MKMEKAYEGKSNSELNKKLLSIKFLSGSSLITLFHVLDEDDHMTIMNKDLHRKKRTKENYNISITLEEVYGLD